MEAIPLPTDNQIETLEHWKFERVKDKLMFGKIWKVDFHQLLDFELV